MVTVKCSCQRLNVQVQASDKWWPLEVCLGFDISVNDKDSGMEGTLNKFIDGTMLSGALDPTEGRDTIQRELDRLEKWAHVKPMGSLEKYC